MSLKYYLRQVELIMNILLHDNTASFIGRSDDVGYDVLLHHHDRNSGTQLR